jgi:signal transduction histidine kinase
VDVSTEVQHIIEEFRPLATSRRATILSAMMPTTPLAIRPDALRHVVLNLLDNAVKYGPTDQTITVSVSERDGQVAITVADQGPGVPERERSSIWRPFARGRAAHSKGGSGIGLTIVSDVATQHGGRAWVEQGEGGGARFIVTFPVDPAPAV